MLRLVFRLAYKVSVGCKDKWYANHVTLIIIILSRCVTLYITQSVNKICLSKCSFTPLLNFSSNSMQPNNNLSCQLQYNNWSKSSASDNRYTLTDSVEMFQLQQKENLMHSIVNRDKNFATTCPWLYDLIFQDRWFR